MNKRLSGLSKTAAAAQVLGMGLLLLISCNNILVSPREGTPAGSGETGTVLISFGNGVAGARTLFPASVAFQRYDLTIEPVLPNAGSTIQETILAGSSAAIALESGTWSIHADAYTDAGGLNKAAEGDSGTITVNPNQTTPVTIALSAVTTAGTGTLSVDISGETAGVISYGYLQIYQGMDFDKEVTFYNGYSNETYASISSSGLDLDISLPAGQYLVALRIDSAAGQMAFINEVAYIYSNLTTELVEVVGAADFAAVTEISGTVHYQENGVDQSGYSLTIYTNPEGTGGSLASTYISTYDTQPYSYTLRVPQPDKPVTLYFHIRNTLVDSLALAANQAAATKNMVLNLSVTTLSGSLSLTLGGAPLAYDSASVYAYPEGGGSSYGATVNGSAWTMSIPQDFSGTLRFTIRAYDNSGLSYSASEVASWTSGSSATTGINLSASFVSVSGSFTATENGTPISGGSIDISASRESVSGSGNFDVYLGWGNHQWTGNTCDWTFITTPLSPSASVQIKITLGVNTVTETVTVGTTNVSIPLKNYTLASTVLSGTLSVTVGGYAPDRVSVYAYAFPSASPPPGEAIPEASVFNATVTNNTWTMAIPQDFSGTLRFTISAYDNSGLSYTASEVASWISGSPTSTGIHLSAYFVRRIEISGSFTVTENGIPISGSDRYLGYDTISAYKESVPGSGDFDVLLSGQFDYDWPRRTCDWTFTTTPLSPSALVQLRIRISIFDDRRITITETETITLGTTNINLSPRTYALTSIVLSGTIGTVTVDGNAPDAVSIYASIRTTSGGTLEDSGGIGIVSSVSGNTWRISGIPDDFTGTLVIRARVEYNGGSYYKYDIATWTPGSPTTDIDLGDIICVTLNGTFGTVTVDGNAPDRGSIYARSTGSSYSGSVRGNSWQIIIPGDFSGTLTISVEVSLNNIGWCEQDIATWTSGSPTTGINLGNMSFVTLSGTIGTVTVDGNATSDVDVYAHTRPVDSIDSRGSVSGNTWQIVVPGNYNGTLAITVQVDLPNVGHGAQDIATWTSGSPTTGISLGNVPFISLSGTIGTVTVNGSAPDYVNVYARSFFTIYPSSIYDNTWQILIPANFTGTLLIGVAPAYNDLTCVKDIATWTSGSPTTGISLGNVSRVISPLSGTVTNAPQSSLLYAVYVLSLSQAPATLSELNNAPMLGLAEITGGAFSGYVESGVTSGYVGVIALDSNGSPLYYITPSPVPLGASMSLSIASMLPVVDDL